MKIASRLWQISKDENAQALVLGTICMALLMAAMTLAADVGYMQYKQTQLQTAADSAAIAAGLEISNCSSTGGVVCANMKTAAENALTEDGITSATITPTSNCTVSSSSSLKMILNVGPCVLGSTSKDPNYGDAYMAEVVLTEPQNTFFGALFGVRTFNLMARAEAGEAYINKPSAAPCVWTGSATLNSDVTIDLQGCSWYDNGNLSPNSGDNVTASSFQYLGTWENPDNCGTPGTSGACVWNLGDAETKPAVTTTVISDPLAGTTPPSVPATQDANNCSISNMDCWNNNVVAGTPVSIPPGYYGGGINVNSGITVNLSPGLYYFNGTFNVDGATLECTTCTAGGAGVTLYFASGTLQMNSSSTVTLNAPAPGNLTTADGGTNVANILVWQSSTNSSGMDVDADSTSVISGIIYLPDAELTVNSGPNMTAAAIDVQSIMVDGNFTITGYNLLGAGSPSSTLGTFALAE
jgi:hypothetical protein